MFRSDTFVASYTRNVPQKYVYGRSLWHVTHDYSQIYITCEQTAAWLPNTKFAESKFRVIELLQEYRQ
jgi:hypothetical protein